MKTLYISYFGLREPLVNTQVLPYLNQIRAEGVDVYLLTFDPTPSNQWASEEQKTWYKRLKERGIYWVSLKYHKRPSAWVTLYDICQGAWTIARLVRREKINILHARSHIPMAMVWLARAFVKCRIVFDVRGLLADEYIAAGTWGGKSGVVRIIKRLEKWGLAYADEVVVLTHRIKQWLIHTQQVPASKISVIPCCVDLSRFPENRILERYDKKEVFELVYVGSVQGRYLLEDMGRFFLALLSKKPNAFLRIWTYDKAAGVAARLIKVGLPLDSFGVGKAQMEELPNYLFRAHLGISFIKPTFALMASSPTKIAEYLAAGLPIISGSGTGDVDELLIKSGVGIVVNGFNKNKYENIIDHALLLAEDPDISLRCVQLARKEFDLESVGGARYRALYRNLFEVQQTEKIHAGVLEK